MRVVLTIILVLIINSTKTRVKKDLNNLYKIIKKEHKGITRVEHNPHIKVVK